MKWKGDMHSLDRLYGDLVALESRVAELERRVKREEEAQRPPYRDSTDTPRPVTKLTVVPDMGSEEIPEDRKPCDV
jgi:hypothetical protein